MCAPVMWVKSQSSPPWHTVTNKTHQIQALWLLGQACDQLAASTARKTHSGEIISDLVLRLLPTAKTLAPPIELERGKATVPLSGINVPFHSSYLRTGIDNYRESLRQMIHKEDILPERLVGKFIPNVMGKTFSVEKSYVEEVARVTGSEPLQRLIENWA